MFKNDSNEGGEKRTQFEQFWGMARDANWMLTR